MRARLAPAWAERERGDAVIFSLFPLGQIVATPGAQAALERANQPPTCFLAREVVGTARNTGKGRTQQGTSSHQSGVVVQLNEDVGDLAPITRAIIRYPCPFGRHQCYV